MYVEVYLNKNIKKREQEKFKRKKLNKTITQLTKETMGVETQVTECNIANIKMKIHNETII